MYAAFIFRMQIRRRLRFSIPEDFSQYLTKMSVAIQNLQFDSRKFIRQFVFNLLFTTCKISQLLLTNGNGSVTYGQLQRQLQDG